MSEIKRLSLLGSREKTSDRQHMLDVSVMKEGETRLQVESRGGAETDAEV